MLAVDLAEQLLESDAFDARDLLLSQDPEEMAWYLHNFQDKMPPEAVRRSGEGYDHQWEIAYKDWLFVVSTYANGEQIWSAYYKTPAFEWSTPEEKKTWMDVGWRR